jgi:hypothetical protein
VICTRRRPSFFRSRGDTFPLSSVPIWSYGVAFTLPFLDVPPCPILLFEKDEVCWSGGTNVPLISRDIKLCARKVVVSINRESPADLDHGPRSLSDSLTGLIMGKTPGRLEL